MRTTTKTASTTTTKTPKAVIAKSIKAPKSAAAATKVSVQKPSAPGKPAKVMVGEHVAGTITKNATHWSARIDTKHAAERFSTRQKGIDRLVELHRRPAGRKMLR